MPKKFEDMRKGIEKSLKKQFPNWSDKEIESRSYAIAVKRWEEKYHENPLKK